MTTTTTRRSTSGTAKKSTTKPYAPAALFRVYDKVSGAVLGYVAPSRNGKDFYHVACDEYGEWHCDCPATVRECCHIKAAKELCEIRVKAGRPGCKFSGGSREQAALVEVEAQQNPIEQWTAAWEAENAENAQPESQTELVEETAETDNGLVVIGLDGKRVPQPRGEKTAWGTLPPKRVTTERGPVSTRMTDILKAPLNGQRGFSLYR